MKNFPVVSGVHARRNTTICEHELVPLGNDRKNSTLSKTMI